MSKSPTVIDRIGITVLKEHLFPCLLREGLNPYYGWDVFRRWVGDCFQRVGVSCHRDDVEEYGELTIGASVGFRSLAEFQKQLPRFGLLDVARPQHFGGGIGHLYPPYQYSPWSIWPDTDAHALGQQVCRKVQQRVFRFFREFATLDKVMGAWESDKATLNELDWSSMLCVYWMRGQRDRAEACIQQRLQQLKERYAREKRRLDLGCIEEVEQFAQSLRALQNEPAGSSTGRGT